MKKADFHFLLLGASYSAFKFAETMVTDRLTTEFRYNVVLNVSRDDPNMEKFDVYPEDADKRYEMIIASEVVDLLCRRSKVPVWIDISVESVAENITVLRLLCAGRYSADAESFYYNRNGSGPFGIKSPVLPPDHSEGSKFKLRVPSFPR